MTSTLRYATCFAALLCFSTLGGAGCTQAAPPGEDGTGDSGDTDTPDGTELNSYYPLVDGATWTYLQKNFAGQVSATENVQAEATTWDGKDVILLRDNENGQGEWTESYIWRDGSHAMRIHKELKTSAGAYTIVDYDPGFTRADDAWDTVGDLGEVTYTRTETDPVTGDELPEERGHNWEINAIGEEVTVPAGTFKCIVVTRTRTTQAAAGTVVKFWYAAGVGKVREERPGEDKIEELIAFDIPGGKSSG